MAAELATQTASAVTEGSAPPQEAVTPEIPVENQGSAPKEVPGQSEQTSETDGGSESSNKAIKELIAQRKKRQQAELEREYWKGVAEGRVAPPDVKPEVIQPQGPPKQPTEGQYETWEEYESANRKYILEMAKYEVKQELALNEQTQQKNRLERTFIERMEEAAKDDPTVFDLIKDESIPVSMPMADVIKYTEKGPQILRWLDQNRADAKRIAALPPVLAAVELGKIEASIINKPKPSPPPRVSAAPEPLKTVTPSGSTEVDEDKLPTDEWIRRRNAEKFKK